MKRIAIAFLTAIISIAAFGQTGNAPFAQQLKKQENTLAIKSQKAKSNETIIWYENFSGERWAGTSDNGEPTPGNAPNGWELHDYTGQGYFWRWDTVGPRGTFTSPGSGDDYCQNPQVPLKSSSAENGFLMMEAGYYNTLPDCSNTMSNMDADAEFTIPIDFTNYDAVHVVFEQWSRYCCAFTSESDAWLKISTDNGENWTAISVHDAPIAEGTNNGHVSRYDVSALVAGESNVTFRIHLQGLSHYHWEIDDIRFVVPIDYDIALNDYWNQYIETYNPNNNDFPAEPTRVFKEGYYEYPWFVTQDFTAFNGALHNNGSMELTNARHKVEILKNGQVDASYESTAIDEFSSGDQDTTNISQTWAPSGKGEYTFVHYATADETDERPENDTLKRTMIIGDSTLCPVDTTVISGSISPSDWTLHVDGRGLGFKTTLPDPGLHGDGNRIDKYIVNGIRTYIPKQNSEVLGIIGAGQASIVAELYKYSELKTSWEVVITSTTRTLTLDDTTSFIYIPFVHDGSSEMLLEGGDYLVNLAFWGTYQTNSSILKTFSIGESNTQKSSQESCVLVDPNGASVSSVATLSAPVIALGMTFDDAYPNTEYTATFNVTDGTNTLENAEIQVGGKTALTNSNGAAVVQLENGTYTYTADKEGFGTSSGSLTITDDAATVDVTINPEYEVIFSITDQENNAAKNVDIHISGSTITTNTNGEASIMLIDGTYNYTLTKLGYTEKTGSVTVNGAGATVEETIEGLTATITFSVTDENANLLPDAEITTNAQTITTDGSGLATIDLNFGTYDYNISKDGYETVDDILGVTGDATIEITLHTLYTISVTVEDESASAIADATITVNEQEALTNTEGLAELQLINGTYEMIVSKTGFVNDTSELVVDGDNVTTTVTLLSGYTVTFEVFADGQPAENAAITINSATIYTDESGLATIDLLNGEYPYTASFGNYNELSGTITVDGSDLTENIAFTGIYEPESNQVRIYPNPSSGIFYVECEDESDIQIVNSAGQIVKTVHVEGKEKINLTDATQGVYFVVFKTENEKFTKRIIITK